MEIDILISWTTHVRMATGRFRSVNLEHRSHKTLNKWRTGETLGIDVQTERNNVYIAFKQSH